MKIQVVLYKPLNPANIGSICRLLKNFDVNERLVLINPECDYKSEPAKKLAKNAQDVLKKIKVVDSLKKINAGLLVGTSAKIPGSYNFLRFYSTPKELVKNLASNSSIALIFGPENYGLPTEIIEQCDSVVRIPTSKSYSALNLSHSVAIMLYELTGSVFDSRIIADKKEKKIVEKYFNKICSIVYSKKESRQKQTASTVIKRVIGRAVLQKREAYTLCGFLKRIIK